MVRHFQLIFAGALFVCFVAAQTLTMAPTSSGGSGLGPTGATGVAGATGTIGSTVRKSGAITGACASDNNMTYYWSSASGASYTIPSAPAANCSVILQNNDTVNTLSIVTGGQSVNGNASNITLSICPALPGPCPTVRLSWDIANSAWVLGNPRGPTGSTGVAGATGSGGGVGAYLKNTNTQTIASDTVTQLTGFSTIYDSSTYTTTANALTVPTGGNGVYVLSATLCWTTFASGSTQVNVFVNGSAANGVGIGSGSVIGQQSPGTSGYCNSSSAVLHLADGDVVTLRAYQYTGGGSLDTTNGVAWGIQK